MLDSGSQVSLWPAHNVHSLRPDSSIKLSAANNIPITAFGFQTRKVKIAGMLYTWNFILARVSRPILGIDFLKHFGMSIDFRSCTLRHNGCESKFINRSAVRQPRVHMVYRDTLTEIKQLLWHFPEVTDPATATTTTKHGVRCFIQTTGPPLKAPPRWLTPDKRKIAKEYFNSMVKAGISRRSNSQWSSALHPVPKSDGSWRPCGDYGRLNGRTVSDNYPLPHLHDFTARLLGCKIFSKVDLVKGYHQIPMTDEDIAKTVIALPYGLFEFVRMPFGLKNAAQAFQWLMDVVMQDLQGIFVYLDDILVASSSPAEQVQHLTALLHRLKDYGLVVNKDKCLFGKSAIEFLGHLVTGDGIKPLKKRVQAALDFERPRMSKQLKRFLGMFNFYHHFIPNAAAVVYPLTRALKGDPKTIVWSEDMSSAFNAAEASSGKLNNAGTPKLQPANSAGHRRQQTRIGSGSPADSKW